MLNSKRKNIFRKVQLDPVAAEAIKLEALKIEEKLIAVQKNLLDAKLTQWESRCTSSCKFLAFYGRKWFSSSNAYGNACLECLYFDSDDGFYYFGTNSDRLSKVILLLSTRGG